MKKSVELLRQKNELKNKIENLKNEGNIAEAKAELVNLQKINDELEIQLTLEAEEIENIGEPTNVLNDVVIDENIIFKKRLTNKALTAEEKAYVENAVGTPGQVEHLDEKGGYLVPEEQSNQIAELRRTEVSLKEYCNVISVTTLKGKFPVSTEQKGKLINFEELNEINQSDITFAQQSWEVKDYGDIIPVSNTLLNDVRINLIDYIGKQFVKKAVNTENDVILTTLKAMTAGTKIAVTKGISDIKTTLNTKLDPAIANNAKIFTNQSGFDYLDNLVDTTNRPLLSLSLTNPATKMLNGKEVVVLPDSFLANPKAGVVPFYIGDMEQAITFYDRMGVEMAISEHAGFTSNATLLRVIERFDVKQFDNAAMVYVELTIPVPAA